MRSPVRLLLIAVGLAVAIYGIAALTGGWLGFPPRYEVTTPIEPDGHAGLITYEAVARDGGEVGAIGLILVGIVMAVVGAWPRRHGSRRGLDA